MFWVWSVGDLKDEGEFFEPHEGWGAARKEDMHHVPLRAFRHSSLVPLLVPRFGSEHQYNTKALCMATLFTTVQASFHLCLKTKILNNIILLPARAVKRSICAER